jgi:hypothetical protein
LRDGGVRVGGAVVLGLHNGSSGPVSPSPAPPSIPPPPRRSLPPLCTPCPDAVVPVYHLMLANFPACCARLQRTRPGVRTAQLVLARAFRRPAPRQARGAWCPQWPVPRGTAPCCCPHRGANLAGPVQPAACCRSSCPGRRPASLPSLHMLQANPRPRRCWPPRRPCAWLISSRGTRSWR